jgi:hypothetical protein
MQAAYFIRAAACPARGTFLVKIVFFKKRVLLLE